MPSLPGDSCRIVAPLLALYDDPNLTEAERVLLSTHLLRCPRCLARVQHYRDQDRQLRTLPGISASPQLHCALRDALAGGPRAGSRVWPPVAAGIATATCAVLLLGSVVAFNLSPAGERPQATVAGIGANDAFSRPLTASLLTANPTRALTRASDPAIAQMTFGSHPIALTGTVQAIYPGENQIVVRLQGTSQEEALALARDLAIVLPNGRRGNLADLSIGAPLRLHGERATSGAAIAHEIFMLR